MQENKGDRYAYQKYFALLVIGIILYIIAYAIRDPQGYTNWIIYFTSIFLISIGYIGLTNQLDSGTACLVQGIVAFTFPLLHSMVFLLIKGTGAVFIIFLLILILGIASLALGNYGRLKWKEGNQRTVKAIRVILFITLAFGIALSYAVIRPYGY